MACFMLKHVQDFRNHAFNDLWKRCMTRSNNASANSLRLYSYAIIPVLIWSINMAVTKYSASVIEPVSISFWRLFIALLLIAPFVLPTVRVQWYQIRQHWMKLLVLGFLAMTIYQCLSYWAGHSTTATNMSIINAFTPIFTILVSLIVLSEKPSRYGVLGSFISLVGLFYLIGQGSLLGLFKGSFYLGDGLMIIAVLAYALYGVLLRHWQLPISLGLSLFVQTALALFMHIPLLMYFGLDALTEANISPILYVALLPSIVAPFLWMKAMQTLGPNRSSIFTNLGPVITAVIAYFYLGEQWVLYHTIGTAMVITGVILAQRKA